MPLSEYACELDRIYGTETEFGLYWNGEKEDILKIVTQEKRLFSINGFIENGGLVKNDSAGSPDFLPEYATPECRSVLDVVCWEKAGEMIMYEIVDFLKTKGFKFRLVKHGRGLLPTGSGERRVTGLNNDISCGHHENYSCTHNLKAQFYNVSSRESGIFGSFLASRIIFSGAGWIDMDDMSYQLSQRADFIVNRSGQDTVKDRALICERDEPLGSLSEHQQPSLVLRLHLIVGDHLMSEVALFLTLGSTGLILRMLESGYPFVGAPILLDPVEAMHQFSCDPLLKTESLLEDNERRINAFQIQEYFCVQAEEFINCNPSTGEEHDIVKRWADVLRRLKTDQSSLYGVLDWVTKLSLIQSYLESCNANWGKTTDFHGIPDKVLGHCMGIDLLYHSISADSIYKRLEDEGLVQRLLTDKEIAHAVHNPPQDTRAAIRGEIMKLIKDGKIPGYISNWNVYYFGSVYYGLGESIGRSGTIITGASIADVGIPMEDPFDFYCQKWQDKKASLLTPE